MFHVYGVGGRLYSGGAENMPVTPVRRIERLDTVHAFMADERAEALDTPTTDTPARPPHGVAQDAVAAYAQAAQPVPARTPRTVDTVMSRTVVTVQADATVAEAAGWLVRHGVGQAPVLDRQQQLVGLIGRAELLAAPDAAAAVEAHMLSPVPAATPTTEVRRVARVLLDSGLPGLPVIDADGGLAGFVARGDLLRVLAEEAALDTWT